MTAKNALAGVAVKDLKAAIDWYARLLGRKPDLQPMTEVAEWQFSGGGWMQVFESPKHAGSSSVTLVETDIEERITDLKAKGIQIFSAIRSDSVAIAIIADPDGNQIVFAQGKSASHRAVM